MDNALQNRFMDPNIPDEAAGSIRPKVLGDFIGHDALKQNLSVFISGARGRVMFRSAVRRCGMRAP